MECKLLDESITEPVADICLYAGQLVVATYDGFLRVYSGHACTARHCIPEIVLKMCADGGYLICGTANGNMLILDGDFNIIQSSYLFPEISVLLVYQDWLIIGSWGGQLAVYAKNRKDDGPLAIQEENRVNSGAKHETPEGDSKSPSVASTEIYILSFVRFSKFKILAAACGHGCIALGLENVVEVYDMHFTNIYKKVVQGVVNSLAVGSSGVYIGLLGGKVYSADFIDSDKSFIFYAHAENKSDVRIYHSVNQLHLDTYLYSAGSDGRICCWDLEKRKLHNYVVSCGCNIKKFILDKHYIYAVLEDVVDRQSIGKVVFAETSS